MPGSRHLLGGAGGLTQGPDLPSISSSSSVGSGGVGPREPILQGRRLEGSRELRGLWTDRGSGGACPGGGRKTQPQGVGSRSGAEPSGRFQVPSLLLPLPPTAFPPSSTTREIIPAPPRPGSAPAPVAGYQPRPGRVSVPNPSSTPPDPFSALFLGPGPRPIPGSRLRADFGPSPDPTRVPGSSQTGVPDPGPCHCPAHLSPGPALLAPPLFLALLRTGSWTWAPLCPHSNPCTLAAPGLSEIPSTT